MRLLICAGGTGGGVYPALSILQAFPTGSNLEQPGREILWVGGIGGMEAELIQRSGIRFEAIPAAGVHGVGLRALPGNLVKLAQGVVASWQILRRFRPDVLLFTGGYVAVPLAVAARLPSLGTRRPRSLVYIPDIEPGLALKTLMHFADYAALTVEDTRAYLRIGLNTAITGYPIRNGLKGWEREQAQKVFGLQDDLPVLLVWGGSKGARSINRALLKDLTVLLGSMQILHLSGQLDWAEVEQARQNLPGDLAQRYHAYAYLHEEMGAAFSVADLVLSRAGASCLGEYPFFGLPAILVPYPHAWRYQRVNAEYLVQRGAAVMLRDEELRAQLLPTVLGLITDESRCQSMRQAMASLAKPQAAETIAGILIKLAESAS